MLAGEVNLMQRNAEQISLEFVGGTPISHARLRVNLKSIQPHDY